MTAQTTVTWLKAVSIATALSVVPLVFAGVPGLSQIADLFIDMAYWPIDGQQRIAASEGKLLGAIAGGVTIGLATFTWMVADRIYSRDPAAARAIILVSLSAWLVTDSLGSLLAGAPVNVLINLVIWGAFVWPLRTVSAESA